MTQFPSSLRFIDQFLHHFQPLLTNTQMSALRAIVYGMFHDYKRLNLSAISRKTNIDYQKLQYFFSESDWSIEQLNKIRLNILANQPTTHFFNFSSEARRLENIAISPKADNGGLFDEGFIAVGFG